MPFARALIDWFERQTALPFRKKRIRIRFGSARLWPADENCCADPYFERFVAQFPTVQALAQAEEEEVLKAWQGLGYYARARNLHKAAQKMVEECGGKVPSEPETLRKMPGIGAYTAGAILSIAYGQKEPAVDGNATRVFARIDEIYEDVLKPQTIRRVTDIIRDMMPDGEAGALTEAIMELGALVCLPQTPQCHICPVAADCLARENGKTDVLPYRSGPKSQKRNSG
ncbi:MAG: A/G-specific adenine glycosylase [Christensenellales bacterium]